MIGCGGYGECGCCGNGRSIAAVGLIVLMNVVVVWWWWLLGVVEVMLEVALW